MNNKFTLLENFAHMSLGAFKFETGVESAVTLSYSLSAPALGIWSSQPVYTGGEQVLWWTWVVETRKIDGVSWVVPDPPFAN